MLATVATAALGQGGCAVCHAPGLCGWQRFTAENVWGLESTLGLAPARGQHLSALPIKALGGGVFAGGGQCRPPLSVRTGCQQRVRPGRCHSLKCPTRQPRAPRERSQPAARCLRPPAATRLACPARARTRLCRHGRPTPHCVAPWAKAGLAGLAGLAGPCLHSWQQPAARAPPPESGQTAGSSGGRPPAWPAGAPCKPAAGFGAAVGGPAERGQNGKPWLRNCMPACKSSQSGLAWWLWCVLAGRAV